MVDNHKYILCPFGGIVNSLKHGIIKFKKNNQCFFCAEFLHNGDKNNMGYFVINSFFFKGKINFGLGEC